MVLQAGRGGQSLGSERQDKSMRALHKVSEMTVWNYDKVPSEQDAVRKALDWVKLAEIMHDDTDEEEEKD